MDDAEDQERHEKMLAMMREGMPGLQGPFTYEERTER
jgi:hypothetical protein